MTTNKPPDILISNERAISSSVLAGTLDPHAIVIPAEALNDCPRIPAIDPAVSLTAHNERAIELSAGRWLEDFDKARSAETGRDELDTRNLISYLLAMTRRQGVELGRRDGVTIHRNIREVIKQIIPLIPVDTQNPDDDFTELQGNLESFGGLWFTAPECEMPLWIGLATTLEEWLEEPKEDWPEWKWRVLSVFTGKEVVGMPILKTSEPANTDRSIQDVIDAMVAVIPADKSDFLQRLQWIKNDAGFKAPELMRVSWEHLANAVNEFIPYPPVEDWQKQVVSILAGEE